MPWTRLILLTDKNVSMKQYSISSLLNKKLLSHSITVQVHPRLISLILFFSPQRELKEIVLESSVNSPLWCHKRTHPHSDVSPTHLPSPSLQAPWHLIPWKGQGRKQIAVNRRLNVQPWVLRYFEAQDLTTCRTSPVSRINTGRQQTGSSDVEEFFTFRHYLHPTPAQTFSIMVLNMFHLKRLSIKQRTSIRWNNHSAAQRKWLHYERGGHGVQLCWRVFWTCDSIYPTWRGAIIHGNGILKRSNYIAGLRGQTFAWLKKKGGEKKKSSNQIIWTAQLRLRRFLAKQAWSNLCTNFKPTRIGSIPACCSHTHLLFL